MRHLFIAVALVAAPLAAPALNPASDPRGTRPMQDLEMEG